MRIKYASEVQSFVMYRSPANFYSNFPFSLLRHYQIYLNASILTTAAFEPGQQFYHATDIGNVATAVSTCAA